MNDKNVQFVVFESTVSRLDKINKRNWILIIILIALLFLTNGAWLYYESQWEYTTTTVTQENENGYNSYIGSDGEIIYGETESNH